MKKNKHIGSSFDSFLEEEGILEEVNAAAIKAIIANNLQAYMQKKGITQTDMAKQLGTSRSGLQRLLDPKNTSITLLTLNKAAAVVGKKIEINLIPTSKTKR
ncbi:helix-turn-helix domain-containing protein [Candidatus Dependentiae bacterium]|nr:helix-turn-helix domain-containing protein [Candidatus Dependentiae bacterium]